MARSQNKRNAEKLGAVEWDRVSDLVSYDILSFSPPRWRSNSHGISSGVAGSKTVYRQFVRRNGSSSELGECVE